MICSPLLRQTVDCTSDSRGPQSVTKPIQPMAKPSFHMPAKCFSSHVDPRSMDLLISHLPIFFFFVSCSVSKLLFPCAHLPYVVFFLILPSNRNPDSHQNTLFAVSVHITEPWEGLGWKGPVIYSNTLQGHPQGTLGMTTN